MQRVKRIFNTATLAALLFFIFGLAAVFYLKYAESRNIVGQQIQNSLLISVTLVFLFSLLLGLVLYFSVTRKVKKLLNMIDLPKAPPLSSNTLNELDRLHQLFTNYQQQMSAQIESFGQDKEHLRNLNHHLQNELHTREQEFNVLKNKLAQENKKRIDFESELKKLQLIIAHSPLSIVITDTVGTIEYVNPRFTEVTGYTFEESMGQNPRILKSGEIPQEVYKVLWKTISSGNSWEGEFHNKKKNGELYWEYAYISPVKSADGKISQYFAVKEDITERKKLNESLKMYLQALTNVAEAVAITDMNSRLVYVNNAFVRLYGYSEKEIIGKNISFLFPKSKHPAIPQNLFSGSQGESWHGEVKSAAKNGKVFDIALTTSIIYSDIKKPIGVIGVSRDITKEKKERELERKTESLKTIQELAGAVSHEFSQPLQALDNYLSLMDMVDEPKKYIAKSRLSLNRISELVNNLRDITSIQRQDYLDTQILNLKASSHKTPGSKTNRILIVDDEVSIQETLVELLEMAGYQCDGASDGLEALNFMRTNEYGLILSDINMPKMSGSDLLEKLQSIGYDGRFIFMTGYAHSKENEEFISQGDGILHKPIDALRLLDVVQKSIGEPV